MNRFAEIDWQALAKTAVTEVLCALDWPQHRLALTEKEAAAALGVGRHVLRDLRLNGGVNYSRIGRKIVYSRDQLLELLLDQIELEDEI